MRKWIIKKKEAKDGGRAKIAAAHKLIEHGTRGKLYTCTVTATGTSKVGCGARARDELWEFFGDDVKGGKYNGEHWEIFGDDRSLTGTLALKG